MDQLGAVGWGVVHKDEARPSIEDFFHDSTYSRL